MNEASNGTTVLISGEADAQTAKKAHTPSDIESTRLRRLRIAYWLVAGVTGFMQIWLQDYIIFGDTLSYLDSGDLIWRGDFANGITNYWSPGLPFLLGLALKILHPVGIWEIAVVKLVDFLIFVFVMGSFDFFVNRFCRYHEKAIQSGHRATGSMLSRPALVTVAYLLFFWAIVELLPPWCTTPDVLMMGVVFLIVGVLLNIRTDATKLLSFSVLGMVLGLGYFVKVPMFLLAFVFMGIAFLLVGDFKKAIPRVMVSLGIFALIAAPLVIELSALNGTPTFGKSGAWNYARTVDGIALPYHWRGEPAGTGTPLHPTRVISQNPTIYEFGSPVRGTFPPWRNPYYWFAGVKPHFDPGGQWRVFRANARIYEGQLSGLPRSFIYGFLILLIMSGNGRGVGELIAQQWFLLVPCMAALAMFSVVWVEGRFIAAYVIVLGMVMFSGVSVLNSENSLKLVNRSVLLAAVLFAASSARPAMGELRSFVKSLHKNKMMIRNGPWQVSSETMSAAMKREGLQKGDQVAYIGGSDDFYWARLAGVQVNAEIRQWDTDYDLYALVPKTRFAGLEHSVDIYWACSPQVKQKIDHILYSAGSKAIVTDALPAGSEMNGWKRISGTPFYIRSLSDAAVSDGPGTTP